MGGRGLILLENSSHSIPLAVSTPKQIPSLPPAQWQQWSTSISSLFCTTGSTVKDLTTVSTFPCAHICRTDLKLKLWPFPSTHGPLPPSFCAKATFAQPGKTRKRVVFKASDNEHEDTNNTLPSLYFSALPNEPVCTENISPWIQLLPCRCATSNSVSTSLENLYLCRITSPHPKAPL